MSECFKPVPDKNSSYDTLWGLLIIFWVNSLLCYHIVKFAQKFNIEALNLKVFYYVEQVAVRSMCCSTTLFQ